MGLASTVPGSLWVTKLALFQPAIRVLKQDRTNPCLLLASTLIQTGAE